MPKFMIQKDFLACSQNVIPEKRNVIPACWYVIPERLECHPGAKLERHPGEHECHPGAYSLVQTACFSPRVLCSILAPAMMLTRSSSARASVKAMRNLFGGLL